MRLYTWSAVALARCVTLMKEKPRKRDMVVREGASVESSITSCRSSLPTTKMSLRASKHDVSSSSLVCGTMGPAFL